MKKIFILICLLNFTLLFSQNSKEIKNNEKYVTEKDFTLNEGRVFIFNKIITIENGEGNLVKVDFSFVSTQEQFKLIDLKTLNEMIKISNTSSKEITKNKYTYVPRIINFGYLDFLSEWAISLEYTAQNDFGATKNDTIVSFFKQNGTYKQTK